MVIAKGVISKAFQKGLIGQKHLRWSIGIGWDEDFNKKVHYHKDSTTDEYGAEIVQNCVHWLFRFVSILRLIVHHPVMVVDLI